MKRIVLLSLLTVSLGVSAQVKPISYPNPNAASLGKYGDIPVSYHTGVPEISIPIYTIKEGPLQLPISLNYHSSGIRVDEVASWVGLGWSLSAGGMITRTVHGGPDEGFILGSIAGIGDSNYQNWGWYIDQGIRNEINQCLSDPLSSNVPVGTTYSANNSCRQIFYEAGKGIIDTQPDLYTFNFAGYSGKFFFGPDQKVHMIPISDVSIIPTVTRGKFLSWKIITPDGTKYFFGGDNATEVTYPDYGESSSHKMVSASTTWNLNRIESINGEHWIEFHYEDDTYSFGNRAGHSVTFREKAVDTYSCYGSGVPPPGQNTGDVYGASDMHKVTSAISVSVVDGRRLSSITTGSGYTSVTFTPSTAGREDLTTCQKNAGGGLIGYSPEIANSTSKSLEFINITVGTLCKKFKLVQDYFSSAECLICPHQGFSFDTKRLRLNSVQEITCTGEALPKHEFTYNSTLLPRRYSLARDRWGYYNGFNSNEGLLEDITNPMFPLAVTYANGTDRSVSETSMMAGMLTKIKFPTGGASEFLYEGHREHEGANIVGGVRVKKITTTDDYGNPTVKDFIYLQGTLYHPLEIINENQNVYETSQGIHFWASDFGRTVSSNPTPPMWSSQGYHIGYSKVKVVQPGNGYSIYQYLNTSPEMIMQTFPQKPSVAAIGTSELTGEAHYKEGADENNALSSTSFTKVNTGSAVTISALKVQPVKEISQCVGPTNYGLYKSYTISTYRFNSTIQEEYKNDVLISTSYTYNNKHNNPITSQYTDSDGVVQKTEFTYASDVGSGAPAAMIDPLDKNMLGTPVEVRSYAGSALTKKQTSTYELTNNRLYLTAFKVYPSGTTDVITENYQYDDKSNLTSIAKSNGNSASYLWDSKNQLPIASVDNAVFAKTNVVTPVMFGTQITANQGTFTSLGTFTANRTQTIAFTPSIQMGASGIITLTIKNAGGTAVFGPKAYTTSSTPSETVTVDAGQYTVCYQSSGFTIPIGAYTSINLTINHVTDVRANLQYISFEENGTVGPEPKTGTKYWSGVYQLSRPHIDGDYKITYWKKASAAGSDWTLQEQIVTVNGSSPATYALGEVGYYIDDVRLHPVNAQMKSFVIDPGKGITSSTDQNNMPSYYDYDNYGRLIMIRDSERNILKTYSYRYKNQPQ